MSKNNPTWGRFHPDTDRETATLKPIRKAESTTDRGDLLDTPYKIKVAENKANRRREHQQKLRELFARNRFCTQCGKSYNYDHLSTHNVCNTKMVCARTRCDDCSDKGNMPRLDSRFCHKCGIQFHHQGMKQNSRELVVECTTCRTKEDNKNVTA